MRRALAASTLRRDGYVRRALPAPRTPVTLQDQILGLILESCIGFWMLLRFRRAGLRFPGG